MRLIPAKTILSSYTSENQWFGSNYNMNIYKGCSHGCIYCDSRSDCYRVENFDEVRAKDNSLTLLAKELKAKRRTGVIGTGAMSDPYNPYEEKYRLTRGALELINGLQFGLAIATKSSLITRDIDVLKKIQSHSPVLIKMTITTSDDKLCKIIEPNVSVSSQRFAAIRELANQELFTGIIMMPILPLITDNEENIRGIIRLAYESGVKFIYPGFGVTLRQNQREWYYNKLDQHFHGIKSKYIQQYGDAYSCQLSNGGKLWGVMKYECDRLGILYRMKDIITAYKSGYEEKQMSLF